MPSTRQPLEVHKFGGASLADPAAIRRAIAILAERPGRRVVVVSAMAGVTDLLLTAAAKAVAEGFLLQADAERLIKQASDSNVLSPQNTASIR